jgi:dipeptidyl aminopeptidase/acylaminoacyl peptidase
VSLRRAPFVALISMLALWVLPPMAASAGCIAGRTQVVVERTLRGNTDLWGLRSNGVRVRLTTARAADTDPSWSPDGTALVFVRGTGRRSELWTLDAETCEETRLTHDDFASTEPDWGEGGLIAFTFRAEGDANIVVMTLHDRQLYLWAQDQADERHPSWSPFDDQIVYASNVDGDWDIYRADESLAMQVTDDPADERNPSWALDGQVIAFTSDRDGNSEVYSVEPTGDAMTRLTTTSAVEAEPTWSRYGLQIVATRTSGATPVVVSLDRDGGTPLTVGIKGSSADVRGPSEFQRWRDSLAKRSVRRTAAAARRFYVEHGTYDGITVIEMASREPELTYVPGSTGSRAPFEVSISEQDTVFTAVACSATGACFAIQETDNALTTYSVDLPPSGEWSANDAEAAGVIAPTWPYS